MVAPYLKSVPKPQDLAQTQPDRPIPSTGMRAPADIKNFHIRLADFGQAEFSPESDKGHEAQLQTMRAPEIIMGLPWDSKVDIWNTACFMSGPAPPFNVIIHI